VLRLRARWMMKVDDNMSGWNVKMNLLVIALLAAILFASFDFGSAVPQGAGITVISSENGSVRPADLHAAQGGSFTTLLLNATSQTSKWKAYAGNVTGKITLANTNNMTIYDWVISDVQGEVYVSRNASVSFSGLACANDANITAEQNFIGINATSDDSINRTFYQKIHSSFVIGGSGTIANSSCYAIATYINDTAQVISENARFQEVLLSDGGNLVYTTLLENKRQGFDTSAYDFQIIVPDTPDETVVTYFFYAELG
jgi:hypothetical protein